ncbi:GNAT family N-acetyltransferase [Mesorhizobium sp. PAMC28654]|uniref:GNAT family N-acetyltransferase n=1 Tax=Mesorhizobium sp. PAMC28654 TaxID=2880934 RepID=UPI001D0A19B2|nr:GNAT family protein [Mesorhizobium sp. PAMC28654]UDL87501.1 GNAT family N-acetyltransferase [Mesorhizobium sp. PAMC28654]
MPKMPQQGARSPLPPLVTPLAAQRLKPVFVDRWSDKVRIRTLKPSEMTNEIAEWLTDPAVMEGLNAPQKAMGLEAFRAYVGSFDNLKRNLMTILRQADDVPLGLAVMEVDLRHRLGSLHLIVGDPENRGRNIAFDASVVLLRHFFRERKLEKITFQPLARNKAAIAVCERSGLRLEGTLRSHRIDGRTGKRLDQMLYALTLEEYEERTKMIAASGVARPYDGPGVSG